MIVNLCPHILNIVGVDGCVVNVAPSGQIARVSTTRASTGTFAGVELFETAFGEVTGLPDPVEGTIFVVSGLVAGAVKNRPDVFSPGELVRGPDGQPIGCKGLSRSV